MYNGHTKHEKAYISYAWTALQCTGGPLCDFLHLMHRRVYTILMCGHLSVCLMLATHNWHNYYFPKQLLFPTSRYKKGRTTDWCIWAFVWALALGGATKTSASDNLGDGFGNPTPKQCWRNNYGEVPVAVQQAKHKQNNYGITQYVNVCVGDTHAMCLGDARYYLWQLWLLCILFCVCLCVGMTII